MWVCAHPDDEFLTGALLARAGIHYGGPVHIVVMTRGEGGANHIGAADLGATRVREMEAVAEQLGATLEVHDFFNAPLPMSSFPKRHELHERWRSQGDPQGVIEAAIEDFVPDIVVTFEPTYGATGHPEHQLTSRLTTAAAAAVARREGPTPEVLYGLRRHWFFRLLRQADPGPVEGWFDGSLPCGDTGHSCIETLIELTRLHQTQHQDLAAYRRFGKLFTRLGLRSVDPATAPRPDEPA